MKTFAISTAIGFAALSLCTDARADVFLRYTFNDGTANDSVGGANASLQGGASVSGGALQFNGFSAYGAMPASAIAINSYTSLTVEMWLTVISSPSAGFSTPFTFGRTDSSTGLGYQYLHFLTHLASGNSWATITPDTFNLARSVPSSQFTLGQEHYVAVTVDGSSISYFLDGGLVGSASLDGVSLSNLSNDVAYLGRSVYLADSYQTGSMNEFRLWNNALSPSEVAAHAAAGPNVIPEPCSLALLGLGIGVVILGRRRE